MKAVLLDWATMGPDLDITTMRALLPDLEVYDDTEDDEVAERIAGAEIVLGNKVMISEELFVGAPDMRFIGLTATGTDNIDLEAATDVRTVARHNVSVANQVLGATARAVDRQVECWQA